MLKKTNITNIKGFLPLFLLLITLISLSHYLPFTSSPPTFAQSTTGKTSLENSQSKDKLSTNAPSPGSDITSNISLILTPAPDIINPTDNEDFQVPEENLKAGIGDDKTAAAGAAGNSHSEGKSLITPNSNQLKANNGSGTTETIKPTVITPANSKKTATSGSSGEPATANSYSKGKSLITANSSNSSSNSSSSNDQVKANNGSGTTETIKPTVITPANSKNTSTAIKDTGKQGIIGTGTGTSNKTISGTSLTGDNKSSPQEINANNSVSKSSNTTSNKTGQQGSSAFPWLDQISKILGVK